MDSLLFSWSPILAPMFGEVEAGTFKGRDLYPLEIKALHNLVAGAHLTERPRLIAPELYATVVEQQTERSAFCGVRNVYVFRRKFPNGLTWQAKLLTDHTLPSQRDKRALKPQFIVKAYAFIEGALDRLAGVQS